MTEENIDIKEETTDEEILEEEKKKVLNFFITTLNGMAYGLFSTLIIGTIIDVDNLNPSLPKSPIKTIPTN